MRLTPKNWGSFQHYKDRSPAWIKLHRSLLDDYEFHCLPVASRALAPCIWLLAAEYENGVIDATPEKIAFRLRMTPAELCEALKPLIDRGFLKPEDGASEVLAECKPDACLEKRREETYTPETEKSAPLAPRVASLSVSDLVEDGLTEQTAVEFLALRKRKRAPLTPRAWDGIKAEVLKARIPVEQAICYALTRGWQSFQADWLDKGKPAKTQHQLNQEATARTLGLMPDKPQGAEIDITATATRVLG